MMNCAYSAEFMQAITEQALALAVYDKVVKNPMAEFILRNNPIAKPEAIAIGSSTGGPQALYTLLPALKGISQPVFITQHMPASFTGVLSERIASFDGLCCQEATDGLAVRDGHIYVARGGYHMTIAQENIRPVIRLNDDPPENFCRPAVDPMLRSLAAVYGKKLLVVILTGMGSDGLMGAHEVIKKGGNLIAQDEASSVVWGMPGAVARAGLCHAVLPLDEMGEAIKQIAQRGKL